MVDSIPLETNIVPTKDFQVTPVVPPTDLEIEPLIAASEAAPIIPSEELEVEQEA